MIRALLREAGRRAYLNTSRLLAKIELPQTRPTSGMPGQWPLECAPVPECRITVEATAQSSTVEDKEKQGKQEEEKKEEEEEEEGKKAVHPINTGLYAAAFNSQLRLRRWSPASKSYAGYRWRPRPTSLRSPPKQCFGENEEEEEELAGQVQKRQDTPDLDRSLKDAETRHRAALAAVEAQRKADLDRSIEKHKRELNCLIDAHIKQFEDQDEENEQELARKDARIQELETQIRLQSTENVERNVTNSEVTAIQELAKRDHRIQELEAQTRLQASQLVEKDVKNSEVTAIQQKLQQQLEAQTIQYESEIKKSKKSVRFVDTTSQNQRLQEQLSQSQEQLEAQAKQITGLQEALACSNRDRAQIEHDTKQVYDNTQAQLSQLQSQLIVAQTQYEDHENTKSQLSHIQGQLIAAQSQFEEHQTTQSQLSELRNQIVCAQSQYENDQNLLMQAQEFVRIRDDTILRLQEDNARLQQLAGVGNVSVESQTQMNDVLALLQEREEEAAKLRDLYEITKRQCDDQLTKTGTAMLETEREKREIQTLKEQQKVLRREKKELSDRLLMEMTKAPTTQNGAVYTRAEYEDLEFQNNFLQDCLDQSEGKNERLEARIRALRSSDVRSEGDEDIDAHEPDAIEDLQNRMERQHIRSTDSVESDVVDDADSEADTEIEDANDDGDNDDDSGDDADDDAFEPQRSRMQNTILKLKTDKDELENEIEFLREKIEDSKLEFAKSKERDWRLHEQQKQQLRSELENLKEDQNRIRDQRQELHDYSLRLRTERNEGREQIDNLRAQSQRLEQALDQKDEELAGLYAKVEDSESQQKRLDEREGTLNYMDEVQVENKKLKDQVRQWKTKYNEDLPHYQNIHKELILLQEQVKAQSAARGQWPTATTTSPLFPRQNDDATMSDTDNQQPVESQLDQLHQKHEADLRAEQIKRAQAEEQAHKYFKQITERDKTIQELQGLPSQEKRAKAAESQATKARAEAERSAAQAAEAQHQLTLAQQGSSAAWQQASQAMQDIQTLQKDLQDLKSEKAVTESLLEAEREYSRQVAARQEAEKNEEKCSSSSTASITSPSAASGAGDLDTSMSTDTDRPISPNKRTIHQSSADEPKGASVSEKKRHRDNNRRRRL